MADITVKMGRGQDLAQIARDGVPDLSTPEKLALCALAVHRAVLQRAAGQGPGEPMEWQGVRGYRWHGAVNYVIDDMWNMEFEDKEAVRAAKRTLNRYLRNTRNLVCTNQGDGNTTPATWFVAAEYNDVPPAVKPTAAQTRAERRLSAIEAGEDRDPYPVETRTATFVCWWPLSEDGKTLCGEVRGTQSWLNRHIYEEHKPAEEWIFEAMQEIGKPAIIQEITDTAARNAYPGSAVHTGVLLHEMYGDGRVHAREASSGQWQFWLAEDSEPEDLEPLAPGGYVLCREPGCRDRGPMTPGERRAHENTVHPDSPHREWWCEVCQDHLWSKQALSRHLDKAHGLHVGDSAYAVAMSQAFHPAAEHEPEPVSSFTPDAVTGFEPADPELDGLTDEQVLGYLAVRLAAGRPGLEAENARLRDENQKLQAQLRKVRLAAEGG